MEVLGTLQSSEGGADTLHVPFQVTNCAALPFSPKFTASVGANPTRQNGESLHAKIVAGVAGEANVHLAKVELPKQLPARLTTLQKACPAATFEANPAACPPASFVGHAKAITPILPVPLEGPAIFVSHGGEAFPSLIFVLQGYGVTVDLVGSTFISKGGVTSSTFKAVPDQPIVSFELTLPQGPYSALAANGNPCALTTTKTARKKVTVEVKGHKKKVTRDVTETRRASLLMPTELIAQNGAEIHQQTKIAVEGCPKIAKKAAKQKQKHGKGGKKK